MTRLSAEALAGICEGAGLTTEQAKIMRLRFVEGLSFAEIGQRTGLQPSSVRSIISRASGRIKRRQEHAAHVEYAEILMATERAMGPLPQQFDGDGLIDYAKTLWDAMQRRQCQPHTPQHSTDYYGQMDEAVVHGKRLTLDDVIDYVRRREEARSIPALFESRLKGRITLDDLHARNEKAGIRTPAGERLHKK